MIWSEMIGAPQEVALEVLTGNLFFARRGLTRLELLLAAYGY